MHINMFISIILAFLVRLAKQEIVRFLYIQWNLAFSDKGIWVRSQLARKLIRLLDQVVSLLVHLLMYTPVLLKTGLRAVVT